ncbi:hypothetical protein Pelo_3753 [Pelomyxa schiedti]|nr:hypothetical protein Pelo_3753 [Pelomyxa schiedti]
MGQRLTRRDALLQEYDGYTPTQLNAVREEAVAAITKEICRQRADAVVEDMKYDLSHLPGAHPGKKLIEPFIERVRIRLAAVKSGRESFQEQVALISALTSTLKFVVSFCYNHSWSDEDFWEDLTVGILLHLGVGAVNGSIGVALTYIVEQIPKIIPILNKGVGATFTPSVCTALVSFLSSTLFYLIVHVWWFHNQMEKKTLIRNGILALVDSFGTAALAPLGPLAIPAFIVISLLATMVLDHYFIESPEAIQNRVIIKLLGPQANEREEQHEEWMKQFLCCIAMDIPRNPVFLHGHLYDSSLLTIWLNKNHSDPMTRLPASVADLIQSEEASLACDKWYAYCQIRERRFAALRAFAFHTCTF